MKKMPDWCKGAEKLHEYPQCSSFEEWLEAICDNVEKFPDVDHTVQWPDGRFMQVPRRGTREFVQHTRAYLAMNRGVN